MRERSAAYLGAIGKSSPNGIAGAALGVVGIFLPGLLMVLGTLPFWDALRQRIGARAATRRVNAAVVGLLGSALYSLLWVKTVRSIGDVAIVLAGFVLLAAWRVSPVLVVILGALAGVASIPLTGS